MFQKIDWFFLSHFEKGCHFLQKMTGKTNYYYSGLCSFLLALISLGVYSHLLPTELVGENPLIFDPSHPISSWFCIFVSVGYFLVGWKLLEVNAYNRLNNKVANSFKTSHLARLFRLFYPIATMLLLLMPISEIKIYDKFFFVLMTLFVFLISCDPLPPCKGKIKKLIKSFGKKPALVPIKTEE